MNKAEEAKKEISQLRIKRQNAIDDARITYLEGFIAGNEYVQQVSREVAIDFREWLYENHWANFSKGPKMEELFNEYWEQKQQ